MVGRRHLKRQPRREGSKILFDILIPLGRDVWGGNYGFKNCAPLAVSVKEVQAGIGRLVLPVPLFDTVEATPRQLINRALDYLQTHVDQSVKKEKDKDHANDFKVLQNLLSLLQEKRKGDDLVPELEADDLDLCQLLDDIDQGKLEILKKDTPISDQVACFSNDLSFILMPHARRKITRSRYKVPESLKIEKLHFAHHQKRSGTPDLDCQKLQKLANSLYYYRRVIQLLSSVLVAAMTAYLVLNTGDLLYAPKLYRSVPIVALAIMAGILNFQVTAGDADLKARQRFAVQLGDKRTLFHAALLRSEAESGYRYRLATFTFSDRLEKAKLKRLRWPLILCPLIAGILLVFELLRLAMNIHLRGDLHSPNISTPPPRNPDSEVAEPDFGWLHRLFPYTKHKGETHASSFLIMIVPILFFIVTVFTHQYRKHFFQLMKNDPSWWGLYYYYLRLYDEPEDKGNSNVVGWIPLKFVGTGWDKSKKRPVEHCARAFIYEQKEASILSQKLKLLPTHIV